MQRLLSILLLQCLRSAIVVASKMPRQSGRLVQSTLNSYSKPMTPRPPLMQLSTGIATSVQGDASEGSSTDELGEFEDEEMETDFPTGADGTPVPKDINWRRLKVRQHVNPLSAKYQMSLALADDWMFRAFEQPTQLPLIVDVGCAKGSWALKMAETSGTSGTISAQTSAGITTDTSAASAESSASASATRATSAISHINVLGLEIRRPVVELCLARKFQRSLTNVHFLAVNANIDLEKILTSLVARGVSISTVCVQFPDPHFKTRHKKRRVVNPELVHINPYTYLYLHINPYAYKYTWNFTY
ncbi:putative methyltransferase-domain-containing protein, partial [Ochromonadaceae sp. CCMP2298]